MKNGIAILEEFLQEKYVENFDSIEKDNNSKIANLVSACPNYFYVPRLENLGMLDYIEYEGKAFYLIRKSGLPQEIQESLVGGDAGEGKYTDYLSLNDVYGVTSNLKVYYCSGGLDSIQNLGKDDVDDAIERDVFTDLENSGLGKLLSPYDSNENGKIQSSEVSSIGSLEITENVDLSDIYNLYSLNQIIIRDVKDINLSGIENCMNLNFIWLYNSTAVNYEPIGKLENKLERLYFSHSDDSQFQNVCIDLGKYDMPNLTYLAFFGTSGSYTWGPSGHLDVSDRSCYGGRYDNLNDITYFDKLTDMTKKAVKYMWLPGNKFTNCDGLKNFINLIYLSVYGNNLNNISGLSNMKKLEYLQLADNVFKDIDGRLDSENYNDGLYSISNLESLTWLDISTNSGIRYISYLSNLKKLQYLYMDGCPNLSLSDVTNLKSFILGMVEKTYDSLYSKRLLDKSTKILSYSGETINITDLKNIGDCIELTSLDLSDVKVIKNEEDILEDDDTIESIMIETFENLKKLQELSIKNLQFDLKDGKGLTKISSLNFLKLEDKTKNEKYLSKTLKGIDLRDTNVVAKGNIIENPYSLENTNILNSLEMLRVIAINTNGFDFSKLETMLNRFEDRHDIGCALLGNTSSTGLLCYNSESISTLNNCSNLKKLISFSYLGPLYFGNVSLDLSHIDSLKYLQIYRWHDIKLTLPSKMDFVCIYCGSAVFDFESVFESRDDSYMISNLRFNEIGGSMVDSFNKSINNLVKAGIKVDLLYIRMGANLDNLNSFLDENERCNWLKKIDYGIVSWESNEDKVGFYEDLGKLSNGNIEELAFYNCPLTTLDFMKKFTNISTLEITNSKIVNINSLKPTYDVDGNLVSGCPNLVTLSLTSNNIANISVLGELSHLENINLSGNIINSGIEELEKLKNLKTLNLTKNDLSKVDKYVNVGTGEGKDYFVNIFKSLHESGNLRELYLTETGVKNIRSRLEASGSWGLNSSQNSALQCDS